MKKYRIIFALSFLTYGIALSVNHYVTARLWADCLALLFGCAVLYELLYIFLLRKKEKVSLGKAIAFYFLCFFTECELTAACYYIRLFFKGHTPTDFLGNVNGETVYGFAAIRADGFANFVFSWVLCVSVIYQMLYILIRQNIRKECKGKGKEGAFLVKNKSGWVLLEHLDIKEEDITKYEKVTGAFAIVTVGGKYLIGYNKWRQQWEFCGGGIEPGETAREAALRELLEETHQKAESLVFKGISRMQRPNGEFCYQAVFVGTVKQLEPFAATEDDEMSEIMLWDLKQEIGYVDECDMKIVEMVCNNGKGEVGA